MARAVNASSFIGLAYVIIDSGLGCVIVKFP